MCERSPHASLHGFAASIDDPVWDRIVPPFDYSCGCMLLGDDSISPVGDLNQVPACVLVTHDWMPIFPSHLKLKRFVATT
jgi:hypothetical protein